MVSDFERKRRWFFALCRELNYDVEKVRERARKKFQLESFSQIQEFQIDFLIDKLLHEKDKREIV